MSTTFTEKQLPDGYIQVSWDAETPREWQRVLHAIKTMIPQKGRAFVKDLKAWTISPEFLSIYEDIKKSTQTESGEEILGSLVDSSIHDEAILSSVNSDLKRLPESMKKRAIFAISAAMDLIDVPVEFSYSRGIFGAWNSEHGNWFYEDGRYSGYSPTEWDEKAITSSYKRIRVAQEHLSKFMEGLDQIPAEREKFLFRLSILEKYNYACFVCEKRPTDLRKLHMHRVLPGKIGGQYIEHNVVLLCVSCHRHYEGDDWDTIKEAKEVRSKENES